jgi:hypothetical protein
MDISDEDKGQHNQSNAKIVPNVLMRDNSSAYKSKEMIQFVRIKGNLKSL